MANPFLDVSDVLRDPEIAGTFTVNRRAETVGLNGRSSVSVTPYSGVIGVVTSASPNDLERLDESQRMGRHLSVVTDFPLRGPAPGFQADTILWGGDTYIVKLIDPYPQYGPGFVQAIIGSIDIIDRAAMMRGIANFADRSQSAMLGVI